MLFFHISCLTIIEKPNQKGLVPVRFLDHIIDMMYVSFASHSTTDASSMMMMTMSLLYGSRDLSRHFPTANKLTVALGVSLGLSLVPIIIRTHHYPTTPTRPCLGSFIHSIDCCCLPTPRHHSVVRGLHSWRQQEQSTTIHIHTGRPTFHQQYFAATNHEKSRLGKQECDSDKDDRGRGSTFANA